MWNQINCRSLTPDQSGFRGLFKNPLFLVIASLTVVGQVLIVNVGGAIFDVEPLGWLDWGLIVGGTAVVLVYAEVVRFIRRVWGRRVQNRVRDVDETRTWQGENDPGTGRSGSVGT